MPMISLTMINCGRLSAIRVSRKVAPPPAPSSPRPSPIRRTRRVCALLADGRSRVGAGLPVPSMQYTAGVGSEPDFFGLQFYAEAIRTIPLFSATTPARATSLRECGKVNKYKETLETEDDRV